MYCYFVQLNWILLAAISFCFIGPLGLSIESERPTSSNCKSALITKFHTILRAEPLNTTSDSDGYIVSLSFDVKKRDSFTSHLLKTCISIQNEFTELIKLCDLDIQETHVFKLYEKSFMVGSKLYVVSNPEDILCSNTIRPSLESLQPVVFDILSPLQDQVIVTNELVIITHISDYTSFNIDKRPFELGNGRDEICFIISSSNLETDFTECFQEYIETPIPSTNNTFTLLLSMEDISYLSTCFLRVIAKRDHLSVYEKTIMFKIVLPQDCPHDDISIDLLDSTLYSAQSHPQDMLCIRLIEHQPDLFIPLEGTESFGGIQLLETLSNTPGIFEYDYNDFLQKTNASEICAKSSPFLADGIIKNTRVKYSLLNLTSFNQANFGKEEGQRDGLRSVLNTIPMEKIPKFTLVSDIDEIIRSSNLQRLKVRIFTFIV